MDELKHFPLSLAVIPVTPITGEEEILRKRYQDIYEESCKKHGVTPVSYLKKRLTEPEIVMKSHGLGPQGAKAVAIALVVSSWPG